MNNNNMNSFVNASSGNNNENLSQFKGYNEYYAELRKAKGRNSKSNNDPSSINLYNNNNNNVSVASDPGPIVEELTPIHSRLSFMNNNNTSIMTKNMLIKSVLSDISIPAEKKQTLQQMIKSLPTGEYERLSREYHGMSNNDTSKPTQFVTFLMERIKQKGGRKHRSQRNRRQQKRRRTNRK